ncbi:SAM-dependent methyltransferase [Propionivibrio dicarboxylicus]|uniref:16S rRNA (Cytidine1402-2'-O)-methyltransferase n=1 Tax=Propionivibrio dicarboxylicus TaxID=83767 RepID=A0A1G8D6N7_9RHOO|nr:SAM-dependent methyltransferase [Propionivibrio dicarboxylicus]SDH53372.1 16S rRNA (cytidine1402-2'-O)-methyltransferase [Propionivibrio dicarboxylicus]
MSAGTLFLIPVPLGPSGVSSVLPPDVCQQAATLRHFVAENAKSARAFLKALPHSLTLQEIAIAELNEHTPSSELLGMLEPLISGSDVGLISEAGCPAVADPGAQLVALAHEKGIQVRPLVGPSSILLALMASGLSGQNFAFHGYLPAKEDQLPRKISALEKDSRAEKRTQIFIETPYRNRRMFDSLLTYCSPHTRLCIATDLTLAEESVRTHAISAWKKIGAPTFDRRPSIFLLQAT